MIDLTGANLVNYMLRMIRDIVERNPRFKNTLGEVTFPANTIIRWKDVWVSMTNVTTSGTRLSPNYFMCTQLGRAILAKVGDKDGQFIEWTREVDPTRTTPPAGVYYMNVDFFDDKTRDIGITVRKYRWVQGKLKNAIGTIVYFRPGIDLSTVVLSDAATSGPVLANMYTDVQIGSFAYLITPTQNLVATYTNGSTAPAWDATSIYDIGAVVTYSGVTYSAIAASPAGVPPEGIPQSATYWAVYSGSNAGQRLAPLTDYWFERPQSAVIIQTTVSGTQLANIPSPYISVTLTDQNDYTLRPGIDYTFQGQQWVVLSAYTPEGSTITANMIVRVNPYDVIANMPENYLQVDLGPNETLAPNQVFIHTPEGNFTGGTVQPNGSVLLPQLLQPGDWLRWDMRIDSGQMKARAKKWEINNLTQVDPNTIEYTKAGPDGTVITQTYQQIQNADPSSTAGFVQSSAGQPLLVAGQQTSILSGLRLAIGDNVVVGDQAAIIVSPSMTETYEVFGSKENLTFTLEVKANDLQTASDLSEMLKRELLIMRRTDTEADGLTIFEVTRAFVGSARDASATAPQYIYTLTVTASADWKVYIPLVTYLANLEITENVPQTDFLGKLQMAPRMKAFGTEIFIPSYG
jgi:hypothetical protein